LKKPGIKNFCKTYAIEGGNHFPRRDCFRLVLLESFQLFAQGFYHLGRNFRNHETIAADGFAYFGALVMLINRAYRADNGALAAEGAEAVDEGLPERSANIIIHAPVRGVDGPHCLDFLADFDAAPAFNAFVHVADKHFAGCFFLVMKGGFAAERRRAYAEALRKGLQITFCIADAAKTILGMIGQKQLDDHFSYAQNADIVRNNFHPFPYFVGTCGNELAPSVAFHNADAADRPPAKIGMIAKDWYLNIDLFCGFKNGGAFRHCHRNSVYAETDVFIGVGPVMAHFLPPVTFA
jgi:hypothetical protein